jgi:hypothetical protein
MWHSAIVMTSAESVKVANGGQLAYAVTLGVRGSRGADDNQNQAFLVGT